jgi:hypothetical protein
MASLHFVEESVSPECGLTRQSGAARLINVQNFVGRSHWSDTEVAGPTLTS